MIASSPHYINFQISIVAQKPRIRIPLIIEFPRNHPFATETFLHFPPSVLSNRINLSIFHGEACDNKFPLPLSFSPSPSPFPSLSRAARAGILLRRPCLPARGTGINLVTESIIRFFFLVLASITGRTRARRNCYHYRGNFIAGLVNWFPWRKKVSIGELATRWGTVIEWDKWGVAGDTWWEWK